LQDNGISVTLNENGLFAGVKESHVFSSLFVYNQKRHVVYLRPTSLKNIIVMLILLSGDIETCPGPWSFNKGDFTIGHQNIRGLWGKRIYCQNFYLRKT